MARWAHSLTKLKAQLDDSAPNRDTASDGWIGDADHQNRASDHNPWVPPPVGGIVTAGDFDHDPANGADMNDFTEALRRSRDPRIKYVIWNKRMFSSYPTSGYDAWEWRPYTGPNLHTIHAHVSVQPTAYLYDLSKPWDIGKDWFDMATKEDLKDIVREVVREEIHDLAVGKTQKAYKRDDVNVKNVLDVLKKVLKRLEGKP